MEPMIFDSFDDENDVDADDDEYLDDDTEDDIDEGDNGSTSYDDPQYDNLDQLPINENTGNILLDIKNR